LAGSADFTNEITGQKETKLSGLLKRTVTARLITELGIMTAMLR
jgi:hypothetical protein